MNRSFSMLMLCALCSPLGACGTSHWSHQGTCLTCFDHPVTGEPLNYDSRRLSNKPVPHEAEAELISTLDVDSAAMRIKRAFGFESEAEVKARLGAKASAWLTQGQDFTWSAQPGSHYVMKRTVPEGALTAIVSKRGSGAHVELIFSADQRNFGVNAVNFLSKAKREAERALKGDVSA